MDWKQLFSDLAKAGLTQTRIGEAVGISQCYVSELASGKKGEPRYSVGKRLVELHRKTVRKGA